MIEINRWKLATSVWQQWLGRATQHIHYSGHLNSWHQSYTTRIIQSWSIYIHLGCVCLRWWLKNYPTASVILLPRYTKRLHPGWGLGPWIKSKTPKWRHSSRSVLHSLEIDLRHPIFSRIPSSLTFMMMTIINANDSSRCWPSIAIYTIFCSVSYWTLLFLDCKTSKLGQVLFGNGNCSCK